ncbi:pyridoxal phosphate-dependent transferase [Phycomyces blakesleeanus]|uniref:Pyridoxal phosphate-dependent transferase n=1 Tax=Phycomyces blakesleeanus TaxID=4837 RepID=A0ABR3B6Q7_PHYBL
MFGTDRKDLATELETMLDMAKTLFVQHVREGQNADQAVVKYTSQNDLYKVIDFDLPNVGKGVDGTFELIKKTLDYSVNSWNPRFMDKLYAGTNPIGVISEMLIAVLNGNSHVYHVSPVFTLMEIQVTKAVGELLNMGENSGGLLCPGGSASNLLAMFTARNKLFPSITKTGYLPRPYPGAEYGPLKIFTSISSHYSIDKAAQVMGLGTNSIIKVPTDSCGRMRVDRLEILIRESVDRGETPFFVNATAGTTVLGAFDPIRAIATVAKQFNCWLHVDGSWGGSVVFSNSAVKTTNWLDGSGLADTFTLNPHKLLGVPLQCSMLLTPHKAHALFAQANSLAADYLFHGNPYDLGAGTIGCGRRPDAVKMFLAWTFYGRQGFGNRVDRALGSAADLTTMVRNRKDRGFILVKDPSPFLQVCFWYIPNHLSNHVLHWEAQGNYTANVSLVTKMLHLRLREIGEFLVDHAPLDSLPHFFRIVINSPTVSVERDLAGLLDAIEEAGKEIEWDRVFG